MLNNNMGQYHNQNRLCKLGLKTEFTILPRKSVPTTWNDHRRETVNNAQTLST